jgi:hypothetical protein
LAKSVDVTLPNLGWFVAGALILLGVLGLLGALRRQPSPAVEEAPVTVPAAADNDTSDDDPDQS